jgi:hypothetical protein
MWHMTKYRFHINFSIVSQLQIHRCKIFPFYCCTSRLKKPHSMHQCTFRCKQYPVYNHHAQLSCNSQPQKGSEDVQKDLYVYFNAVNTFTRRLMKDSHCLVMARERSFRDNEKTRNNKDLLGMLFSIRGDPRLYSEF